MTKIIVIEKFDFRPDADWRTIVELLPSEEPQTVTRECATKAIKAGAAKAYRKPKSSKGKPNEKRSTETQTQD